MLDEAHAAVRPGVTTDDIDRVVHEATVGFGAYPSPYNYYNFPRSVCTSVNEVWPLLGRGTTGRDRHAACCMGGEPLPAGIPGVLGCPVHLLPDPYPYPHPYPFSHMLQVICHGIPDRRPLQSGDIVNVDVSVYYKGFHGDLNETFVVGEVDEASKQLIKVTSEVRGGACADFLLQCNNKISRSSNTRNSCK